MKNNTKLNGTWRKFCIKKMKFCTVQKVCSAFFPILLVVWIRILRVAEHGISLLMYLTYRGNLTGSWRSWLTQREREQSENILYMLQCCLFSTLILYCRYKNVNIVNLSPSIYRMSPINEITFQTLAGQ